MKPSYSMWAWWALCTAVGSTCIAQPELLTGALGAGVAPGALALARLLGIVMVAYGFGYGVAAFTGGRAFMRASVLLRASSLPLVAGLVALGWLPAPLLALGLLDGAGALWTWAELRARQA